MKDINKEFDEEFPVDKDGSISRYRSKHFLIEKLTELAKEMIGEEIKENHQIEWLNDLNRKSGYNQKRQEIIGIAKKYKLDI